MNPMKVVSVSCIALLLAAFVVSPAFASLGKIAGTVKDKDTGEALPGVNVVLEGTMLGASTDPEGRYFILNVPPGEYAVTAKMVGYKTETLTGVLSKSDATTTVSFELEATVIEVAEAIVVVAERPLVDKTLTASRSTVTATELNNALPVRSIDDIIETTASSFRNFIRGGRQFETKTLIDGVDVSDPFYSRGTGTNVVKGYNQVTRSKADDPALSNSSAIEELSVLAGTFNAEYPAATAGVVNIVTKQGGSNLSGRVFYRTSVGDLEHKGPDVYFDYKDYYVPNRELLKSESLDSEGNVVDPAKYDWYNAFDFTPGDYDYGDKPTQELEVSLGGPMTARSNFHVTGRLYSSYGRLPNEYERKLSLTTKLNYSLQPDMKLGLSFLLDDGGYYSNTWNRAFNDGWKYSLEDMPQYQLGRLMGALTFTHNLSPKTLYEVKVSQLSKTRLDGFPDESDDVITFEGPADSTKYYGNGDGYRELESGEKELVRFHHAPRNALNNIMYENWGSNWFLVRWPGIYYEKRQISTTTLKADVTSQVTHEHQLKAGFQVRLHTVDQNLKMTQVYIPQDMWYEWDQYEFSPKEYSLYVQDMMEYAGMVVNAGVRVDGFNSDAEQISDLFAPLYGTDWNEPVNVGADGAEGDPWKFNRGEKPETKWMVSPRLGVSHPIGENMVMHYSWGRFFQMPLWSQLYDQYGLHCTSIFPSPNPDLDPIKAVAYEMGIQRSFGREYSMDVTAYYRDVDNYANTGIAIKTGNQWGSSQYQLPINFGYADARGVELTLGKRPSAVYSLGKGLDFGISGRASYAYSYIKMSAGGLNNVTTFTKADSANGIPFDDLERLNSYERPAFGGGSSITGGSDRTHRISASLLFDLPYRAKISSVITAESGFWYDDSIDPRERHYVEGPWSFNTNLRIEKSVGYGRYQAKLFLDVQNLLDRENILGFHTKWTQDRTLWREGGTSAWQGEVDPKEDPTGQFGRVVFDDGSPVYGPARTLYSGIEFAF